MFPGAAGLPILLTARFKTLRNGIAIDSIVVISLPRTPAALRFGVGALDPSIYGFGARIFAALTVVADVVPDFRLMRFNIQRFCGSSGGFTTSTIQPVLPFRLFPIITKVIGIFFVFGFRLFPSMERRSLDLGTGTIETLASPPQNNGSSEDFLGVSCLPQASSFIESPVQDKGPNNGYRFVTQVSPLNNGRPTTFEYIVVTDLLNSGNPFFVAQCGNLNAQTNPNGFISRTQLTIDVFDHESGTVLSRC